MSNVDKALKILDETLQGYEPRQERKDAVQDMQDAGLLTPVPTHYESGEVEWDHPMGFVNAEDGVITAVYKNEEIENTSDYGTLSRNRNSLVIENPSHARQLAYDAKRDMVLVRQERWVSADLLTPQGDTHGTNQTTITART